MKVKVLFAAYRMYRLVLEGIRIGKEEGMASVITWLKERLNEPSTYKGLLAVLGLIGLSIPIEILQQVGAVLIAVIGLWEMVRNQAKSRAKVKE